MDGERGAAVVEFALVVPILLMLLVGIIEFGRAYNVMISIQGASREGARALALGRPAGEVESTTRGSTSVAIDTVVQTPCSAPGQAARVTVTRGSPDGNCSSSWAWARMRSVFSGGR